MVTGSPPGQGGMTAAEDGSVKEPLPGMAAGGKDGAKLFWVFVVFLHEKKKLIDRPKAGPASRLPAREEAAS